MIKPIQTYYNGYHFRSRLEARWAVFFDSLRINYQYELEGFDLGIAWYLPDFYLTDWDIWIEIKPVLPHEDVVEKDGEKIIMIRKSGEFSSIAKMTILMQQWNEEKNKGNKQHFIFYGTPGLPKIEINKESWRLVDGSIGFCPTVIDGKIYLCAATFAKVGSGKSLDIWPFYFNGEQLENGLIRYLNPVFPDYYIQRIYCGEGIVYDSPDLLEAYQKARSERFSTKN